MFGLVKVPVRLFESCSYLTGAITLFQVILLPPDHKPLFATILMIPCWWHFMTPYGVTGPQWLNRLWLYTCNYHVLNKHVVHITLIFLSCKIMFILTHLGLVTPYGDIDLGPCWLRWWLTAWWHQAIIWTNIDLSPKVFSGIQLRVISQEVLMNLFRDMCSEIALKKGGQLRGANELILW